MGRVCWARSSQTLGCFSSCHQWMHQAPKKKENQQPSATTSSIITSPMAPTEQKQREMLFLARDRNPNIKCYFLSLFFALAARNCDQIYAYLGHLKVCVHFVSLWGNLVYFWENKCMGYYILMLLHTVLKLSTTKMKNHIKIYGCVCIVYNFLFSSFLSAQFNRINYIHSDVQPSPLPISKMFPSLQTASLGSYKFPWGKHFEL